MRSVAVVYISKEPFAFAPFVDSARNWRQLRSSAPTQPRRKKAAEDSSGGGGGGNMVKPVN